MEQTRKINRIRNSSGTHGQLMVERVAMTGGFDNFYFMRDLPEILSQTLLVNVEGSKINGSTKEGAEDNLYSFLIGDVNVTSRDPKAGNWFTNLSGKNTTAYVMVRQDDLLGSYFQKLANAQRNQVMHHSFAAVGFSGALEINAHSVSLASHNRTPVLVIEVDFAHGRDGSRWAVVDYPYGDAMQSAIDSRRKTSDDSPEVAPEPEPEPEPTPPAKARKPRSSRKSTPDAEMEAAIS